MTKQVKQTMNELWKVLCEQGRQFLKNQDPKSALSVFEEARVLNADNFYIHILIGESLRRLGRHREAISKLYHAQELFELSAGKKGMDYSGGCPKINYYLALCWQSLGDVKKSVELLQETAQELFPGLHGGEKELSAEAVATFGLVENVLAEKKYSDAFELLKPLVFQELVAKAQGGGTASR